MTGDHVRMGGELVRRLLKFMAIFLAAWMLGMLSPATGTVTSFPVLAMPVADAAGAAAPVPAGSDKMAQITLIIKKLRESMASLKDLDALEKAGMPKKDVDRMRRALEQKNQEMINQAIAEIRSL
jgi:hypothetical protein